MIPREEIESWVKEALTATDKEYQLVEVVRTAIELTASKCAEIADGVEEMVRQKYPESGMRSEKIAVAARIALEIREAIGYKIVDGPMPNPNSTKGEGK